MFEGEKNFISDNLGAETKSPKETPGRRITKEEIKEWYPKITGFINRHWKNQPGKDADAEEMAQEVFQRAWQSDFKGENEKGEGAGIGAWLYSIARSVITDRYRYQKAESKFRNPENMVQIDDQVVDDRLVRQSGKVTSSNKTILEEPKAPTEESLNLKMDMEKILGTLKPSESELFRLREGEGFSIKEIAVMTGKSEGTVKTMLFRIREKLKGKISDEGLNAKK